MGMGIMARRPQNIIDPRGMFNILIEGRPDEGASYLAPPRCVPNPTDEYGQTASWHCGLKPLLRSVTPWWGCYVLRTVRRCGEMTRINPQSRYLPR